MFLPNKSGYGLPTFLQIESSKYSARSFWFGGAYLVSHWTKTKWNNFANENDGGIMECLPFEYALPELWLLLSLR
jgi:hypothetical protein